MSNSADVAIIGGGIIGLSAAYSLAKAGLSVAVFDRTEFGREASWAGAGIIPPGNPERAATPIDQLRAIGSVRFPRFSAELREVTGIDNGYRPCGGIEFLQPTDEEVVRLWNAEGITFEKLTPARLHELEPSVAQPSGEPYYLPQCAQVRNPWHLRALVAACERQGIAIHKHQAIRQIETSGDRVRSIRFGDGESFHAGTYLLAAGAWSGAFLQPLGFQPLIQPVRGQIVLLHAPGCQLQRIIMLGKEYLVPRGDGRVLIGSTEEPEAGFEKANTEAAVAHLRALACKTVPALAEARMETCWAGLRPGSPDGLPFLGSVPGVKNLFIAAGHFRAGVQLSLGTTQVICDLIQGRQPGIALEDFRLDRSTSAPRRSAFRS